VKYAEALFLQQPWLITPQAHAALVSAVQSFFNSPPPPFSPEADSSLLTIEDGVGVITIDGPIMRRPDIIARFIFGATDTDEVIAAVREAQSRPDVQAVMLDFDSPGGTVGGTPELAQAIADLSAQKYTYAFTGGQLCSAAYWAASQSDAIYASPSARIGSIGVLMPVVDRSESLRNDGIKVEVFAAGKFKSAGTPGVPLTDDQRALIQSDVEEIATDFRTAVLARGRKIPADAMEGQTFSARKAVNNSLICAVVPDRDTVFAKLQDRHVVTPAS
jgi:signal peptide peptidase SppA